MEKIYNNLSIENLIKTDWINQFDEKLQEMLQDGLAAKLDVFVYAKPEYNWFQMLQIRLGLEVKLDVSIYADPKFTYSQMKQIRTGLEDNLDVSIYVKTELSAKHIINISKK